jgi:MinD superfamily P-loop ATPase
MKLNFLITTTKRDKLKKDETLKITDIKKMSYTYITHLKMESDLEINLANLLNRKFVSILHEIDDDDVFLKILEISLSTDIVRVVANTDPIVKKDDKSDGMMIMKEFLDEINNNSSGYLLD